MNQDGSTATPNEPETQAPNYATPNDLDFEMSQEEEQGYVDQILASGNYTPPVADDAPAPVPEPTAVPEPETPPAPAPEPQPEPEKEVQTEISAPQTDDLWVEVERVVTDELGEETVETVKLVYDPADPSSFIPDDFTARSTKQLADIMEAKAEMAKIYGERQSDFEKAEATKAAAQHDKDILAGWDAEIKDLIDAGVLEAPKLKEGEAGYGQDPAVMKTDAVFQFMADKNAERAKNGIAPISSFGLAYTMYENDEAIKAAAEAEKKEEEETKTKGAMIGGGSAASGGTPDQLAYKSGSYKNIWDVKVEA